MVLIVIPFHHSFVVLWCISIFARNEEKLAPLLVYSTFRRVPTSGVLNNSVATSSSIWIGQAVLKWGVNMESLRYQHSTAAQNSYWIGYDVTRLVATEHLRSKLSLLDSFTLIHNRTLLVKKIQTALSKLTLDTINQL